MRRSVSLVPAQSAVIASQCAHWRGNPSSSQQVFLLRQQILPFRVTPAYQLVFPFPAPTFYLLFSFNGGRHIRCRFIVHQLCDSIARSKSFFIHVISVFPQPSLQVICHTSIYGGICCICEDIHKIHINDPASSYTSLSGVRIPTTSLRTGLGMTE